MSKVLVVGYSPPPFASDMKVEAAHYRTWQFLEPLLADGHSVCLVSGDQPGPSDGHLSTPANLSFRHIRYGQIRSLGRLQQIHDTFDPDCIIAVNFRPCLLAARLNTIKPLWLDIYGDPITIQQAACYRAGSDRGIVTSIHFAAEVMRRGDIFSACGQAQEHLLVGQLAQTGRLNARTFGYKFVYSIPPGVQSVRRSRAKECGRHFLTRFGIEDGHFVVLWAGGYNTWTDVPTLFAGLDVALAKNSRMHFVSVGASTYEGPDDNYGRFTELVEKSSFRNRFHLLGWRPWKEMADFYNESDVGINVDSYHYETVYGTRTRLVEMMGYGLPLVTSSGCDLSHFLKESHAALVFPIGDGEGLADCLLRLASEAKHVERIKSAAEQIIERELSFAVTTRPLRKWVQRPGRAPDKVDLGVKSRLQSREYLLRAVVRYWLWRHLGLDQ